LKLEYDKLLSTSAFNFILRRYIMDDDGDSDDDAEEKKPPAPKVGSCTFGRVETRVQSAWFQDFRIQRA
jgi:hypothetical protein